MPVHQHSRDRKTEPESSLLPDEAALSLHKQVEDARKQLGRNPAAVVTALENDLRVLPPCGQHHSTVWLGVLAGVRQQVRNHLRNANAIAVDHEAMGHVNDELVMLF